MLDHLQFSMVQFSGGSFVFHAGQAVVLMRRNTDGRERGLVKKKKKKKRGKGRSLAVHREKSMFCTQGGGRDMRCLLLSGICSSIVETSLFLWRSS